MAKVTTVRDYNGFGARSTRLGLDELVNEAIATLEVDLRVEEKKHANGTKGLREMIDAGFEQAGGWTKVTVGGIDWSKANDSGAKVGVEVQVSGRSDLLAVDVIHLRDDLMAGVIDAGIIIVPDNELSNYLTDRTPNLRTAIRHVESRAADMAIRLVAFRHDGPGDALPKMRTNMGRLPDSN